MANIMLMQNMRIRVEMEMENALVGITPMYSKYVDFSNHVTYTVQGYIYVYNVHFIWIE